MIFGTIMPCSSLFSQNNGRIDFEPCSVFKLPVEGSFITFSLLISIANLLELSEPIELTLKIENEHDELINSFTGRFTDTATVDNVITSMTFNNLKIPHFGVYTMSLFLGSNSDTSENPIAKCKVEFKEDE